MKLLIFFGLLCTGTAVSAQTACPTGVAAGSAQCGPSPSSHGVNPPPAEPLIRYVPTGRWDTTWGAIAFAKSTGDLGVSVGKISESEATREAIRSCADHGPDDCEVSLSYENQCAVIAWASEGGELVNGPSFVQSGPSVESAEQVALDACSKLRNGGGCKIIYSACTKPVFVSF